jgi:hypothetical protein
MDLGTFPSVAIGISSELAQIHQSRLVQKDVERLCLGKTLCHV